MELLRRVSAEFRAAPIGTTAALLAVLTTLGGLIAGGLWLAGSTGTSGELSSRPVAESDRNLSSLAVILVFLGSTCGASFLNLVLYRAQRRVAVFASVIIASLSAFLNRINTMFFGIGPLGSGQAKSVDELIFFGTVFIFVAVWGLSALADFFRPTV